MKVEVIPHLVHHLPDALHLIDVIPHHAQIWIGEVIPQHWWSHMFANMFQGDPAHPLICFAMVLQPPI